MLGVLVLFIGVDIGGTKCAVTCGLKTKDGKIEFINKSRIETKDYSEPYDVLEKLAEEIEKFNIDKIEAIGISCGGPLDSASGVILSPPNLPGWDNIKITEFFKNRFGVEAYLQNDANACALAEWKFGAGAGTENMIFLTFGTGMGAGLVLNGKLYSGTNDMAGEVGHIRLEDDGPIGFGKAGSFEGFCSGGGIAQLGKAKAKELLQANKPCGFCKSTDEIDKITAKSIAESAKCGDKDAIEIYKLSARRLGQSLSFLIDILNPQKIVIGSVFTRSYDLMYDEMRKVIDAETLPLSNNVCTVCKAALGERIGDYAAISVAIDFYERNL